MIIANSGKELIITNVKRGTEILIRGSGNNSYYIGFVDSNGEISTLISDGTHTDFKYDTNSSQLSMPKNGYYIYAVK